AAYCGCCRAFCRDFAMLAASHPRRISHPKGVRHRTRAGARPRTNAAPTVRPDRIARRPLRHRAVPSGKTNRSRKMNIMKQRHSLFALGLLAVAAAGCGGDAGESAGDDPIRIGVLYATSGAGTTSGVPALLGHNMVVDKINAAGGLL